MIELNLTAENLARLAAMNGYGSVEDLAAELGRNRVTLYTALHRPASYRPTVKALDHALPFRQVRTVNTRAGVRGSVQTRLQNN